MTARAAPPVRVLQFGTGRLLRGLCADIFSRANANPGVPWEGSVIAVQSTGAHRADAINARGGAFTLRTRGLRRGTPIDEAREITALSSAIAAQRDWDRVLEIARSPSLDLIVSNTTEAGLRVPDTADNLDAAAPPPTFIGKLLAVLVERSHMHPDRPIAVVPCELIESNGVVLREAVLSHADRCGVDRDAVAWIRGRVRFADSLVDRICTAPGVNDDPLDTVVEPYALWAIRDPDGATGPLSFAAPDTGGHDSPADAGARAFVHPDITPFYARKVRVLNGSHIATVHLGLLSGLNTVGEVMGTAFTRRFLDGLIDREILPALAHDGIEGGRAFADDVIDRFSNPHLSHSLAEIEKGSAQKVAIRLAPTARAHAARTGEPAPLVTLALAGWAERTRRVLLGSPGADAVLGTAVDRALAGAAGEPSRFAEALFGTVDSAFGAGVEGGDVADTAARIAESGPESAIACALG